MIKTWLTWINYALAAIIALLLFATLVYKVTRTTEFPMEDVIARKATVPKGAFARPAEEYQKINKPALNLAFAPLSVQLPDLRRHLVYYGKNGCPDASVDNPVMYFAFTGNKTPVPMLYGQRLYILYDKSQNPPQYIFSPGNAKTPVWIEAQPQGTQAAVKVSMEVDNGQVIREPAAYADFNLPEKEFVRFGGGVWELGKFRVDGTLLARQKARWYGLDRFLEKYGGEEYKDLQHKQRIDFGEGDDLYSVYVALGQCLTWKDNRWVPLKEGETALDSVLLCVKKIDDRVMNLELWDIDGKGKISLNLIKVHEAWLPKNLEDSYKFVGARTRSQLIFEIDDERMLLRPHDWLILTPEDGWQKLETSKDIDAYIERKLIGPLFVFDHIERRDDRPVVFGTLFNAARTEMVPVEFSLQQNNGPSSPQPPQPGPSQHKYRDDNPRRPMREGAGMEYMNREYMEGPEGPMD